jgi:hypothetical protein
MAMRMTRQQLKNLQCQTFQNFNLLFEVTHYFEFWLLFLEFPHLPLISSLHLLPWTMHSSCVALIPIPLASLLTMASGHPQIYFVLWNASLRPFQDTTLRLWEHCYGKGSEVLHWKQSFFFTIWFWCIWAI